LYKITTEIAMISLKTELTYIFFISKIHIHWLDLEPKTSPSTLLLLTYKQV